MKDNFKNRHFLTLLDYSKEEIEFLIRLSLTLKKDKQKKREKKYLLDKNIALIFEKDSTRTRCAFEVAAYDQGANVTYLGPSGSQIGNKESIKDTARVLGSMYDAIEYRGFEQSRVEELAKYAGVPVWNGLTNEYHPTQILADLMTIRETSDKEFKNIKLCYLGDGRNNMGNSLLIGASKLGMDFRVAAPKECQPAEELVNKCTDIAKDSKAKINITSNIDEAVKDCDFIYTDVWVSLGEPESKWEERIKLLQPYQINTELIQKCNNPELKFLHCLPSFHNTETKVGMQIYNKFGLEAMEVTDEVFESEYSVVFQQAGNRMHTIKAVMVATLSDI